MATDQSEAAWTAIRTRMLSDNAIVAALGTSPATKITRRALPGDNLPCIINLSMEADDLGTDDTDASIVRIELHIWAKANDIVSGQARGALLKSLIKASLHWAPIGTRCTVERAFGPLPDPQNDLHHFVVIAEIITDHVEL